MLIVVRTFRLTLAFALLSLVSVPCGAEEAVSAHTQQGRGIVQFPPDLRVRVDRMLAQSPTFREQYRRVIERSGVVVVGRFDPLMARHNFMAQSTIQRYDSGLMVVRVTLAPGPRVEEYIAHEFEHIVEQLEGIDLTELARRGVPGIWFSGPSVIETSRATRAGRAVHDEMRARNHAPDNLVQ